MVGNQTIADLLSAQIDTHVYSALIVSVQRIKLTRCSGLALIVVNRVSSASHVHHLGKVSFAVALLLFVAIHQLRDHRMLLLLRCLPIQLGVHLIRRMGTVGELGKLTGVVGGLQPVRMVQISRVCIVAAFQLTA